MHLSSKFFPVNIENECRYGNPSENQLSYIVDLTDKIKTVLGNIVEKVSVSETPNLRVRDKNPLAVESEEDGSIMICPYYEKGITIEFKNGGILDISGSDSIWVNFSKKVTRGQIPDYEVKVVPKFDLNERLPPLCQKPH